MNENDLRDLLHGMTGTEPPLRLDAEDIVARGRRRVNRRTATAGLVAVGAVAAISLPLSIAAAGSGDHDSGRTGGRPTAPLPPREATLVPMPAPPTPTRMATRTPLPAHTTTAIPMPTRGPARVPLSALPELPRMSPPIATSSGIPPILPTRLAPPTSFPGLETFPKQSPTAVPGSPRRTTGPSAIPTPAGRYPAPNGMRVTQLPPPPPVGVK